MPRPFHTYYKTLVALLQVSERAMQGGDGGRKAPEPRPPQSDARAYLLLIPRFRTPPPFRFPFVRIRLRESSRRERVTPLSAGLTGRLGRPLLLAADAPFVLPSVLRDSIHSRRSSGLLRGKWSRLGRRRRGLAGAPPFVSLKGPKHSSNRAFQKLRETPRCSTFQARPR